MKIFYLLIFLFYYSLLLSQGAGTGVFDIDGNYYETVVCGNKEWIKSIRVTKFSDGTEIPNSIINDNSTGGDNMTIIP